MSHALAHCADHIGADGRGRKSELGFGERELGLHGADRDVAGRHKADAACVRRAVHPRDGGLGKAVQRLEHVRERLGVGVVPLERVARHALHPVQVRACAEGGAGPHEHDRAHRVVGIELSERLREVRDQLIVECIADLRPVQDEDRALVADGEFEVLCHFVPLLFRVTCGRRRTSCLRPER